MKSKKRLLSFLVAALLALIATVCLLVPGNAPLSFFTGRTVLAGNTPAHISDAQVVAHAQSEKKIRVVIGLKLRNEAELDALIAHQADPASPDFRRYLTTQGFAQRFSPTQADYDKVVNYLKRQGFTVVTTPSNRMVVEAEASVGQVEQAFNVKINQYRFDGKDFYSNASDPTVPAEIGSLVQSVMGLNSFAQAHHSHTALNTNAAGATIAGFTPRQIASAYNLPNANNPRAKRAYSGAGFVIAIATANTYSRDDVQAYWKQFGIVRTGIIQDINVGGASTKLEGETTLDLEQIGAQAPGADIYMYMAADPKVSTFSLEFDEAVSDDVDIISTSWGLCELDKGPAAMVTDRSIFKEAAAQGIPVFASTGDKGAYDCRSTKEPLLAVESPASDPNVTAVGGSSLYLNSDDSRLSESAWVSAGGGNSSWPRPKWQFGPGIASGEQRQLADVALDADPWTGYAIYFQGKWSVSGGTSFAAPNWAAIWALLDEQVGFRVGDANPMLYTIGSSAEYHKVFYDVTAGNNGDYRGAGYNAGPNWDYPTGWGTPDAAALGNWADRYFWHLTPEQLNGGY